jgi:hypothetical protein
MSGFNLAFCDSRRKKQLYNVPLPRIDVVSPYFNRITGAQIVDTNNVPITPKRLDMRRKVEILKYSSNRMPAQTNSLTKKEKWSQLVNASGKSARLLDPETVVCPGETTVRVPKPMHSSASGVPGPSIFLYEEPEVPLYNYIIPRSYAYNIPEDNSYWATTINTNVGIGSGIKGVVFAVNVNANINRSRVSFSLDIPIGLAIRGIYTHVNGNSQVQPITLRASSAKMYVFCNGKAIPSVPPISIAGVNKYITCIPTVNGSTPVSTECIRYVGNLSVSNIMLEMQYLYVFEFLLAIELTVENTNRWSELQYYAYANMTDVIPQTATNMTVTGTSLPTTAIQLPNTPALFGV